MSPAAAAILVVTFSAASAAATRGVLSRSPRRPSSKTRRGRKKALPALPETGGYVVIPMLCCGWLLSAVLAIASPGTGAVGLVTIGLAIVSWYGSRHGIPALYQFTAQAAAVVLGLIFLPGAGHIFQGLLPVTADLIATTVLWLAFIHGSCRLDAEDGRTSVEYCALGTGAALVGLVAGGSAAGILGPGLVATAILLGYLVWAWPPAHIRLGINSVIPLSYAMAWLVFGLAGAGYWAAALILPLRYIAEIAFMLSTRTRELLRSNAGHITVPVPAAITSQRSPSSGLKQRVASNALLIALAGLSVFWPWPALLLASVSLSPLPRFLSGKLVPGIKGLR